MDAETLRRLATATAQHLPEAEPGFPFGPDWEVWKVRGKVFLLLPERGEPMVTLKCDPEESVALQQAFAEVTPGYHMNKKHWITLHPGSGLDAATVTECVEGSYALVLDTLPRSRRPSWAPAPRR